MIPALLAAALLAAAGWLTLRPRPLPGLLGRAPSLAPEDARVLAAVDLQRLGLAHLLEDPDVVQGLRESRAARRWGPWMGLHLEDLAGHLPSSTALTAAPRGEGELLWWGLLAFAGEDRAGAFLTRLREKKPRGYRREEHRGVALEIPADGNGLSWARHRGLVIVAPSPEGVKRGVESLVGKAPSLAESRRFREAVARLEARDGALVFVDLASLLAERLPEALAPLAGSLGTAALGSRADTQGILTHGFASLDLPADGPLAPLRREAGVEFRSPGLFPAEAPVYGAFDARLAWEIAYRVLGTMERFRDLRETPELRLRERGIDLNRDVLDRLTGELAYLRRGEGSNLARRLRGERPDGLAGQPCALALGLADEEGIRDLLEAQAGPMLRRLRLKKHREQLYRAADGRTFGFVGGFLVAALHQGEDTYRELLDAWAEGKTIDTLPGYQPVRRFLEEGRRLVLSRVHLAAVYREAAEEMPDDPGTARVLQALADAFEDSWHGVRLGPEGVSGIWRVTSQRRPANQAAAISPAQ